MIYQLCDIAGLRPYLWQRTMLRQNHWAKRAVALETWPIRPRLAIDDMTDRTCDLLRPR